MVFVKFGINKHASLTGVKEYGDYMQVQINIQINVSQPEEASPEKAIVKKQGWIQSRKDRFYLLWCLLLRLVVMLG